MLQAVLRIYIFFNFYYDFGLWKNAIFNQDSQSFHFHSKVIVRVGSTLAYKFVYLVGTWCRKRFLRIFNFENFITLLDFENVPDFL